MGPCVYLYSFGSRFVGMMDLLHGHLLVRSSTRMTWDAERLPLASIGVASGLDTQHSAHPSRSADSSTAVVLRRQVATLPDAVQMARRAGMTLVCLSTLAHGFSVMPHRTSIQPVHHMSIATTQIALPCIMSATALDDLRASKAASSGIRELHTSREYRKALQTIDTSDTTVIFYGARYCRLCHRLLPRLHAVARLTGHRRTNFFLIYHTKATHDAFKESGVTQIPTLALLHPAGEREPQLLPATPEAISWLDSMVCEAEEAWEEDGGGDPDGDPWRA